MQEIFMQKKIFTYCIILISLCVGILFGSCSSYFNSLKHLKVSPETLAQNSRMVLLASQDDKLKIVAKMTYLNEIDNSIYRNREYFFLEIFNDDEDVILPDSMQITMFNRKPLWIRPINTDELDDILVLENELSSGYLIAFRRASAFEQKKINIELSITNFKKGVFDFSYVLLKSKL